MLKKLASATLAILLMGGLPAHAHSQLVDANPRPNVSYKTSPKNITLGFNEELLDLGAKANVITLTTSRNQRVSTKPVNVKGNQLVAEISNQLKPGRYIIWWRALSADGHPISGKFNFTISK